MICEHCGANLDVGALVCTECRREQGQSAAPARPAEPDAPVAFDQPCPKHPDRPVAGACPRCGAFVCIRCAPGAANDVLTCVDCLAREQKQYEPEPSPFGGPLVFPLLGLVFNALAFGAGGVVVILRSGWGGLAPLQQAICAGMLALTALMGVTLAGYLQRRRWAPWAMVFIYAADIAVALAGGAFRGWIAWCLAWLVYFLAAGRVKKTFTR